MLQQPSLAISLAHTSPDKSLVHLIVLSSRICILRLSDSAPPRLPPCRWEQGAVLSLITSRGWRLKRYHSEWSFHICLPYFWNENHCPWDWASCKNQPHLHPTVSLFSLLSLHSSHHVPSSSGRHHHLASLASRISPLICVKQTISVPPLPPSHLLLL